MTRDREEEVTVDEIFNNKTIPRRNCRCVSILGNVLGNIMGDFQLVLGLQINWFVL